MELLSRDYQITPIFSPSAATIDSRFGKCQDHLSLAAEICGRPPLRTIAEAEPIGPKKLFDALIVAPCTGNTMAKIAHSIADTVVTMAVKSHLRNGRPVILALSSNDALGGGAENLGKLLARKHIYFVPFGQDDPSEKPTSMIADFNRIPQTLAAALEGKQVQPILL